MRKLATWLALAALVMLVSTGIAVAVAAKKPKGTSTVAATFTAAAASNVATQTCTGSDGVYQITKGDYTGTSVSTDPRLNGALKIHAKSVLNTTKGLGFVAAKLEIRNPASGAMAKGSLIAVNTAGQLRGFIRGKVKKPEAKLLANFSATFTGATGFTAGKLGAGASNDSAIVFSGACAGAKPKK
jgi:hypothetical protein